MSSIKEFDHLKIPLQHLKSTTHNFNDNDLIGRGGFGKVYKGELLLSTGLTTVAIKRLDTALGQGAPEFWKEIMMLSHYKHENLVSLLGFCDESGFLTKESDVYSFGVVLFEVLCGRLCVQTYKEIGPFLARLAQQHYEEKKLDLIIDGSLKDQISTKCLETFSTIAYQCLQIDRVKRPSMTEIVRELENALKYQIKENLENGELLEMEDSGLWFSSLHDNHSSSREEGETDSRYYEILLEDLNIREQCLHQVTLFEQQEYPDDVIRSFKNEVSLIKRLRHPNILVLIGAVISPQPLGIVTELLPRGSLFQMLHPNPSQLNWRIRLGMAVDVAKGMSYLHHRKPPIVHRELNSSNLFIHNNWTLKVGDLGLSSIKQQLYIKPQWMAPEILRDEPSNEKADVFSYGVILWEITREKIPWESLNPAQVIAAVGFKGKRLEIPTDVDPLWASLIKSCWCNEPWSRPTFQEILKTLANLQKRFEAE
ncbi:Protein kinase, ATP binding site-containing protein [Cynara cardunculus var. scolymus]|uniref:non-specific serine/threonine protein kinase n=1 Tax=Cynara cardunculus var. scolymus TaxID=59895 RepID=A0A103XZL2_CYNCS|nr:Protein kinase, ATP binding site-containing protein [Cynara cardunculus var. scolymus]